MSTVLSYILAFGLLAIYLLVTNRKFKGWIGEISVDYKLDKLNRSEEEYTIMHDIIVPTVNGKTTQIDHLVISKYGVFVIETKNFRGWIMGSEHNPYWTQVIYKRKEKLFNPVRQNYGHIKSIETIIGEEYIDSIKGIVCFTGRATLKVNVTKSHVIYTEQLVKTIQGYSNALLSNTEVHDICNKISRVQLSGKEAKKDHLKSVKATVKYKAQQMDSDICPKCGQSLIVRKGKYGSFKGCSSFPKCRFVYNL